jgi:hydroxymethylpyrimidine pyrophosphatase-like HAD family hydrolase
VTGPSGPGRLDGAGGTGRRLVALDIDGTLMGWGGDIDPEVVKAVQELRDGGDHVVLATGRSVVSTVPVAHRLGLLEGPAVSSNGAVSLHLDPAEASGYRITGTVTFDPAPALRLIKAELPDALFAVEDVGRGFWVSSPFPPDEIEGEHTMVDFEHLCSLEATRVVIRSPDHTEADFHAMVERLGLHEVSYSVGWIAWLDLNPQGVSKASALEVVRRELGVGSADTVAVGDGRNDVEMLRWAGRGVAMGHADDVTRAAADEVTGTFEDGGVLDVLRSLLD